MQLKRRKSFKTQLKWQENCLSFVVNELQMYVCTYRNLKTYLNEKSAATEQLTLKSATFFPPGIDGPPVFPTVV